MAKHPWSSTRRCGAAALVLGIAVGFGGCANGGSAGAPPDEASTEAGLDTSPGTDASTTDAPTDTTREASTAPEAGSSSGGEGQEASGEAGEGGAGATDAPGDGPCPGQEILCGSVCVDPTSDPTHCGGCNTICPSGICGAALAADMTVQPPNWSFNGVAVWDPSGPSARLTTAKTESVAGTVVYDHPIVTDSFQAQFQFRIGAGGGGAYDGMGFMLEVDGPTALGGNGGGLGMSGLDGYGVELDIYNNGQCGDSNANHVGVDLLSKCGSGYLTSLFASPDLTGTVTLADAQWHTAAVELASGAVSVGIDAHNVANVTLTSFAPGTSYYFGFAGAIGGGGSSLGMQTEVKDVTVTFPSPRCL
jgi:hypothetical protein